MGVFAGDFPGLPRADFSALDFFSRRPREAEILPAVHVSWVAPLRDRLVEGLQRFVLHR
jgi:hypothetical protein